MGLLFTDSLFEGGIDEVEFFQAIIVMIFDFYEILGEASVIYRVKC
jgi:hypothetical protein